MSLASLSEATAGDFLTRQVYVDSYCATYHKVIREAGDGTIKATLGVKRRLAANEITYRCLCEFWEQEVCTKALAQNQPR